MDGAEISVLGSTDVVKVSRWRAGVGKRADLRDAVVLLERLDAAP